MDGERLLDAKQINQSVNTAIRKKKKIDCKRASNKPLEGENVKPYHLLEWGLEGKGHYGNCEAGGEVKD